MLVFLKRLSFFSIGIVLSQAVFSSNYEGRISELERQMLEVSIEPKKGVYGAKFASSTKARNKVRFEIIGELLVWKAGTGSQDYAYSTDSLGLEKPKIPFKGVVQSLSFDFDVGFRAGFTLGLTKDFWDISLLYTRFTTSASRHHNKGWPEGFMGLTGYLSPAVETKVDYDISYNCLDLSVLKDYFLSYSFKVEPALGIKTVWVKQNQSSRYYLDLQQQDRLFFESNLTDVCKYVGAGPFFQVKSGFFLGSGFSLNFGGASALLYGKYKITDKYFSREEKIISNEKKEESSFVNLEGNSSFISPIAELYFGLDYQEFIYQEKVQIKISAGYEILYFWRQSEILAARGNLKQDYSSIPSSIKSVSFQRTAEDLTFQGLTLVLSLSF